MSSHWLTLISSKAAIVSLALLWACAEMPHNTITDTRSMPETFIPADACNDQIAARGVAVSISLYLYVWAPGFAGALGSQLCLLQ